MRILMLCTLVATTIFTADSADAGRRRRRCCTTQNYSYNQCCPTAYNQYQYGQPSNQCGPTGACQAWNGQVYNTTASVQYSVAAPIQAACVPAQPVTYNAGYPPSTDPNAGVAPMAPPVPQNVTTPPPPEPINNEPAPSPN